MATRKVLRGFKRNEPGNEPTNGNVVAVADEHNNDADNDLGTVDTGNTDSDNGIINPGDIGNDNPTGTEERKKRKYTKRNTGTGKKDSPENLASLLYSLHMMGAVWLKEPMLALPKEQALEMGAAIQRVSDLYNGFIIPEKAAAWMNLAIVAARVEGPRVALAFQRLRVSKAKLHVMPNGQVGVSATITEAEHDPVTEQ